MKRALVLNSALSWTAYQIGALRHVIVDQALHFDVCAGTGLGAICAAFVACDKFNVLEQFWLHFKFRQLLSFNWQTPWRGLFTTTPLRSFIETHISEEQLVARGVTLLISTMNLQTGKEQVLRFPGADLPLADALTAGIATTGLFAPVLSHEQQLADATFINSFLLPKVLQEPVEEIIAIAPALQRGVPTKKRYKIWPTTFVRALYMNLAHDVWGALDRGEKISNAAKAFRNVSDNLPTLLATHVTEPTLQAQLKHTITAIYQQSSYPLKFASGPTIKAITPSHDLDYPLWRFPAKNLAAARAAGYRDAGTTLLQYPEMDRKKRKNPSPPPTSSDVGGSNRTTTRKSGGLVQGLFFTPGAAMTAYEVGAAQALVNEGGLQFAVIAGSSAGALNGAFTATGQVDQLVKLWSSWHTQDVLGTDWAGLLRGRFFWSPQLMQERPLMHTISTYINEQSLQPGVRLRFNLANLSTADQEFFEWPGAPFPLSDGVKAAVSVPGVIEPYAIQDTQWGDGLTVDGFPLEQLVLETGVERVFVLGVAPQTLDSQPYTNIYQMLTRSMKLNQFSETYMGLEQAQRRNELIKQWNADRLSVEQAIETLVEDVDVRAELQAKIECTYRKAAFPYTRKVVEIVPILPKHEISMFFSDYQPKRSQELIGQGRQDALQALARLEPATILISKS